MDNGIRRLLEHLDRLGDPQPEPHLPADLRSSVHPALQAGWVKPGMTYYKSPDPKAEEASRMLHVGITDEGRHMLQL